MITNIIKKFVELLFSKNSYHVAKQELVCTEPKTLTIKNNGEIFDLYYLKNGIVCSAIDTLSKMKIPSYKYFKNHVLIPKSYFDIADKLQLQLDKETYIRIAVNWMEESANTVFYGNIRKTDLPSSLPDDWGNIETVILNLYTNAWSLSKQNPLPSFYADLFQINGNGCFITGYGKSDACKPIAAPDPIFDSVITEKRNERVYGTAGRLGGTKDFCEIQYCIHMLSPEQSIETQIKEIDLFEYMRYAEGNLHCDAGSVEDFYFCFKEIPVKYLLIPYYAILEEKTVAIKDYIDNDVL